MTRLSHPDGDALEIEPIDAELVGVTVREGPHEVCRLAFTGPELDVLIARLQQARAEVKP